MYIYPYSFRSGSESIPPTPVSQERTEDTSFAEEILVVEDVEELEVHSISPC